MILTYHHYYLTLYYKEVSMDINFIMSKEAAEAIEIVALCITFAIVLTALVRRS